VGTRQVLRAVVLLVAIARVAHGASVAVLELRPPGASVAARQAVVTALAKHPSLTLVSEPVAEALTGEEPGAAELAAALAEMTGHLGALRCPAAAEAASRAFTLALARGDRPALVQSLSARLVCSDGAGDRRGASSASALLHALVEARPETVPPAVWDRYPQVDLSSEKPVTVLIESEPAGAQVELDFSVRGVTPLKLALAPGEHALTLDAAGRRRDARTFTVENAPLSVEATLAEDPRQALRARVAGWRRTGFPTAAALGQAMNEAGVELVVLLVSADRAARAEVWRATSSGPVRVGFSNLDDPARAAELAASPPVAPVPVPPARKKRSTWVWVAVGAGVALAIGFVFLAGSGSDTQRIEVRFP
jgi:hypothetical protein